MHINEISEDIHANAIAKGFWEEDNLCKKLLLIVSEVTEAMEADRKNKYASDDIGIVNSIDDHLVFVGRFEKRIKDTFEDEMADTCIRIFDLCGKMNIDLEAHILAKHRYNKTRDYLHNKKY